MPSRGACASLRNLHPGELTLRTPVFEDLHERHRTTAVWPVLAAAFARLAFVVVVARRARLEKLPPRSREADDRLHPLRLRFLRDFDGPDLMVECVLDDVRDVLALLVQHVREVHRESRLRVADHKAV